MDPLDPPVSAEEYAAAMKILYPEHHDRVLTVLKNSKRLALIPEEPDDGTT